MKINKKELEDKLVVSAFESELRQQAQPSGNRIAVALLKNVAAYKEPTLFDDEEIVERDKAILKSVQESCLTKGRKPVALTTKQAQLTIILSDVLDGDNGEDIQKLVKWTKSVEDFGLKAAGKQPTDSIKRFLQLKPIAQKLFGRSKAEQINKTVKELTKLALTKQTMTLGTHKITVRAPLLKLGYEITDDAPELGRNLDVIEVEFCTMFFWNKDRRYWKRPENLYEEWNKKKSILNAEIGYTMLFAVGARQSDYWIAADHARRAIAKEAENMNWTPEQLKQAEAERVRNALTYEEHISTIKSRLKTDYNSKRQYKSKFKADMEKVFEQLKKLGMITDGYLTKAKTRKQGANIKAVFIISEQLRENPNSLLLPNE